MRNGTSARVVRSSSDGRVDGGGRVWREEFVDEDRSDGGEPGEKSQGNRRPSWVWVVEGKRR